MKINNYFIDKYFGGLSKKEIMLIGCPSGFGKTTFGNCLTFNILSAGLKPAFMSLENPVGDTLKAKAFLLWKAKTKNWNIKQREWEELPEDEIKKEAYIDAYNLLQNFILIESDKAYDVHQLEKDLESLKERGANVIIIDHFDYIDADSTNAALIGLQVMQTIKSFVDKNEIPVIVFSQLIKNIDHRVIIPKPSDLYGSANKYKMATSVIMIQRDKESQHPDEHRYGTLFVIRKDRYGNEVNVGERIFYDSKTGDYEYFGYKISASIDGTKIKELENE